MIYVIHGMHSPFTSERSTDELVRDLRDEGFEVQEIRYNFYDPLSRMRARTDVMSLSSDDILIAHSYGGIMASTTPSMASVINVNSILSDISGSQDWLTRSTIQNVEGSGHRIDAPITDAIISRIDELNKN